MKPFAGGGSLISSLPSASQQLNSSSFTRLRTKLPDLIPTSTIEDMISSITLPLGALGMANTELLTRGGEEELEVWEREREEEALVGGLTSTTTNTNTLGHPSLLLVSLALNYRTNRIYTFHSFSTREVFEKEGSS